MVNLLKLRFYVVSNEITYQFIPHTFIEYLMCLWTVLGAEHMAVNVASTSPTFWEGHGGGDSSA